MKILVFLNLRKSKKEKLLKFFQSLLLHSVTALCLLWREQHLKKTSTTNHMKKETVKQLETRSTVSTVNQRMLMHLARSSSLLAISNTDLFLFQLVCLFQMAKNNKGTSVNNNNLKQVQLLYQKKLTDNVVSERNGHKKKQCN